MPTEILRFGEDEYVLWSTVVDAPTAWGTREQMIAKIIEWEAEKVREETAVRFDRADECLGGSSIVDRRPLEERTFMYLQRGTLTGDQLRDFLRSYKSGPGGEDLYDESLLKPIEW